MLRLISSKQLDGLRELRTSQHIAQGKTDVSRLKRLAPFFLAGPISGPLLAGVVFNVRGGRPILAALYVIALVEYTLLLPALVAKLTLAAAI
jgi:hypothetical protein